ncbi:MAG: hypothetical protein KDJ27_14170 [Gammaproteobacteria bacterium]|nr:hypothetical protein [Gammaproteobacteria bacterium]
MKNVISLQDIAHDRRDQPSYHLASEKHLRIQVFNLDEDETLGPWACDGNVLITVVDGVIEMSIDAETQRTTPLWQAVVLPHQIFGLTARDAGAVVQLVWAPPFAELREVSER